MSLNITRTEKNVDLETFAGFPVLRLSDRFIFSSFVNFLFGYVQQTKLPAKLSVNF